MAVIRNECEVVIISICSFVWSRFSLGYVVQCLSVVGERRRRLLPMGGTYFTLITPDRAKPST